MCFRSNGWLDAIPQLNKRTECEYNEKKSCRTELCVIYVQRRSHEKRTQNNEFTERERYFFFVFCNGFKI